MVPSTRNKSLIGAAGVHYVAGELCRRGMIALPTTRNTAGYDLIVASPTGKHHANLQVKTSRSRVRFWPMQQLKHYSQQDYFVLVRWTHTRFEAFMLTGAQAKAHLKAGVKRLKQAKKKYFLGVSLQHGHEKQWRKFWETWHV